MDTSETRHELVGLFIRTAQGHHAATGGVNPQWAEWYAEHSVDELNDLTGLEMSTDQLAEWLEEADRRYRAEPQDESWPKAYADWFLAEQL